MQYFKKIIILIILGIIPQSLAAQTLNVPENQTVRAGENIALSYSIALNEGPIQIRGFETTLIYPDELEFVGAEVGDGMSQNFNIETRQFTINGLNAIKILVTDLHSPRGFLYSSNQQIAVINFRISEEIDAGTAEILYANTYLSTDTGSEVKIDNSKKTILEFCIDISEVILSPVSQMIYVGNTATFSATILPENATEKTLIWESSDTSIASIDNMGVVTGVSPGTASIKCTTLNGKSATAVVKVNPIPVTYISLDKTSYIGREGELIQLTATIEPDNVTEKTIIWSSSNEDKVTVNDAGLISLVGIGTSTISATCGGLSATCNVTVVKVTGLELESIDDNDNGTLIDGILKIDVDFHLKLSIKTIPVIDALPELNWTVGDNNIATIFPTNEISSNVDLIGVSEGRTTLTVALADDDNISTTVDVIVTADAGINIISSEKDDRPFDVYTIGGQVVMLKAEPTDLLTLDKGAYVICRGSKTKIILLR